MTRYEAYIKKDWQESGQAYVVAARLRDNGAVELGALLLDTWCLGVKDAVFVDDYTEEGYRDALKNHLPDDERQAVHPAYAKKLIEGAVAYAQQFGFAPHRDYKKTRRIFNGVDPEACTEIFTYGKDGKPCFVASEDDAPERIDRILAMLEAHCGTMGFEFEDPAADEEDAIEYARENLQAWLEEQDDTVPGFYEFSGIVTGMLLCPDLMQPLKITETLWPPPGRTWKDAAETQEFTDVLMHYWNEVNSLILYSISPEAEPEHTCIDVWEEDFEEEDRIAYLVALRNWAAGVIRATTLWPNECAHFLTRPDLASHWELLRVLAQLEEPGNSARIAAMGKETPPRLLGPSVMALARALRQPL